MKCPHCHFENSDSSRFCAACGTQLYPSKEVPVSPTITLKSPLKVLPKGTTFAGKYKILGELGRGGMGIVYKAEDSKLKRTVALKFLPPELTLDPEARERFIQEAQAASAFDHPNICTIHEIEETEAGQMYIAMACYEGESLKEKMAKGPMKIEEASDIAIQIAQGLAKAHQKGIVHRDIKPANIMITNDGEAKIVDFGLAKLARQLKLTRAGTTIGTAAYMSPEQARGEAVDHRTDIWSLGVVLYEMLTGQLPFKGDELQGTIYSILNKTPEPLSALRPDIPRPIQQVVARALEKDPARRYQNTQGLIQDLKTLSPYVFSKPEKSIVVLPFEDMSPGKDNEYFSDGLTEEVISDLSQVNSLLVISRSSAMTFKGTKKKIGEIAKELNVQYILEGSVRKAGNNLRITSQLIDAKNDAHLWAEKYNGTLDDVFDIQEKVSRAIVDSLKLKLSPGEERRISEHPIPNALAYEFYLKARQEILKWTEAGLENAVRYLQRGLEIIGENALLHAGMAYVFCQYFNLGIKEEEYCRKEAVDYLKKAFALDPHLSLGNFVHGMLQATDNPKGAIRYFKRVLKTNPNDFDTLFFLSCGLGTLGQRQAVIPLG